LWVADKTVIHLTRAILNALEIFIIERYTNLRLYLYLYRLTLPYLTTADCPENKYCVCQTLHLSLGTIYLLT